MGTWADYRKNVALYGLSTEKVVHVYMAYLLTKEACMVREGVKALAYQLCL